MSYTDYAGMMAGILSALLFFGPEIRQRLQPHALQVSSFGGGVAIAYVFFILFPEIEHSREWYGASVHTITVASLLIFYALEIVLLRRRPPGTDPGSGHEDAGRSHHTTGRFWFHIAIIWFYTWLVVFTLPHEAVDHLIYVLAGSATIGVHLLYKDYVLRSHYDARYQAAGRYVLALAPIAGWLTHQVIEPSEGVLEVMIAILAGILIQGVFRDELPPVEKVRFRWLLGGVAVMGGLALIT